MPSNTSTCGKNLDNMCIYGCKTCVQNCAKSGPLAKSSKTMCKRPLFNTSCSQILYTVFHLKKPTFPSLKRCFYTISTDTYNYYNYLINKNIIVNRNEVQ